MTDKLTWKEYQRVKDIKHLDLQWCDFCQRINILNLGWTPFRKYYCKEEEKEHVLCPSLCLKVARGVLGCELYLEVPKDRPPILPTKPNKPYDLAKCYLCGKELEGASKKSVIKNRNNPGFWGVSSSYKILCLGCIGKKFYNRLVDWQRKKFREYRRRGYV